MMDQYKEQYKKETEQIHAPADLIARTKAAVREEEARIQREQMAQKKAGRSATARKWAYPLTAVAAICVLVSVSMMMRGLEKSGSDSTSYESAAGADCGAAEFAVEETVEEAVPETALVSQEAVEEETDGAATSMGMGLSEKTGGAEDDVEMSSVSPSTSKVTESVDETKRAASEEAPLESGSIEKAMSQKQEETLADSALQTEDVMIEKVMKKPDFVDRGDAESRTYKDIVFQLTLEGDGWAAYVESENGDGYVIRGEMETAEEFLKAGYKKLTEIGF